MNVLCNPSKGIFPNFLSILFQNTEQPQLNYRGTKDFAEVSSNWKDALEKVFESLESYLVAHQLVGQEFYVHFQYKDIYYVLYNFEITSEKVTSEEMCEMFPYDSRWKILVLEQEHTMNPHVVYAQLN